MTLNPAQRRAATFGTPAPEKGVTAGPLLILAGAGTGKTNTLAHRAAHLVLNGVDPGRILMLTFTRRAAQEMIRRAQTHRRARSWPIAARSAIAACSRGCCGPAHFIRWATGSCVCSPSISGSIPISRCSTAPMRPISWTWCGTSSGFSTKDKRFPRKDACLAIYSYRVNTRLSLKQTIEEQFPWVHGVGSRT